MSSGADAETANDFSRGESPLAGWQAFALVALLIAATVGLFLATRPPTVEEVERDVWEDWTRLAVDSQGRTLVDQLLDDQQPAGQQMLDSLGRLIENHGDEFVVPTGVRRLRILDKAGRPFASWESPEPAGGIGWKELSIDLVDPVEGKVGVLEVSYRFYVGGLETLPNIRRLSRIYGAALGLVAVLALVALLAAAANMYRLRERAARMRSQQAIIDLARQMCHELRNGLWAFSLEGRNVRQLFDRVSEFASAEPEAFAEAAARLALSEAERDRLRRVYRRRLAERGLDPETDLAADNELARQAHEHIEGFSRYINLTVEELDRNLLGAVGVWEPEVVQLSEAWREAAALLEIRLKSAGVSLSESFEASSDQVTADRRALVHVFVNLIKNAVEAMRELPGDRRIRFQTLDAADRVLCRVQNTGPAVPPKTLEQWFHRGYTTKQGAGRGTGLAFVADSIHRMGATIAASSDPVEGTVLEMSFPRCESTSPSLS